MESGDMSEECPSSDGHAATKKVSAIIKCARKQNYMASVLYIIDFLLTAMTALGHGDRGSYGDSGMVAILQPRIDIVVPARSKSISPEIFILQTISDIV